MKRLANLSYLLAAFVLSGSPSQLMACGTARVVTHQAAYVAPVVATNYAYQAPVIATFALLVPAVAVGTYPAPQAAAMPSDADKRLDRLEKLLTKLVEAQTLPPLQPAQTTPRVPAPPPSPPEASRLGADTPLVAGLKTCFSCHAVGSTAKGTSFVFFSSKGESYPLEDDAVKNVLKHIDAGTMPKGTTLTAEQKTAIHQLMDPEGKLASK